MNGFITGCSILRVHLLDAWLMLPCASIRNDQVLLLDSLLILPMHLPVVAGLCTESIYLEVQVCYAQCTLTRDLGGLTDAPWFLFNQPRGIIHSWGLILPSNILGMAVESNAPFHDVHPRGGGISWLLELRCMRPNKKTQYQTQVTGRAKPGLNTG